MRYGTFLARAGAILLSLVLTGCIFFESSRDRAARKDPNFQQGYADGCASANARGTDFRGDKIRDAALYETSQPYRSGWGAGYTLCNNQLGRSANPNTQDFPDQRPNP